MSNIITIKEIVSLGIKELRYTLLNGESKFDIRQWKGEKALDGVRFNFEELKKFVEIDKKGDLDNKHIDIYDGNYRMSIENNGRIYTRDICSVDEFEKLKEIVDKCSKESELITYKEEPIVESVTKKRGRPKKSESKVEPKKEEKKVYINGFVKFSDMFEAFRKNHSEERQKGFEVAHNIILQHIKEVCENSKEYNEKCLQEWKNSQKLMQYITEQAFKNPEMLMTDFENGNIIVCGWVDEYIGLDDKPEPPKKKETKKKTTTTKKKTKKAS